MVIAFDGGAFQQGIEGGIFNVALGFLNAIAKADSSMEFVLVGDPRLGPIRPELLDRLTFMPDVLLEEIGPAYGPPPHGCISDDAAPYFVVDGVTVRPDRSGAWIFYQGPTPHQCLIIASHNLRPSDAGNSTDRRNLGICFDRIIIEGEDGDKRHIAYDCQELSEGYYPPEAGYRWTTGQGVVPLELMPKVGMVRVAVRVLGAVPHSVANGRFDPAFKEIQRQLAARSHHLAVNELANKLRRRGVDTYFVNHFLPVTFPGIKLVSWAYDIIPLLFPNHFMGDALANFRSVVDVFRKADHIFSISETTKRDLSTHLSIEPARVTAVGIDVTEELEPPAPEVINDVLEKFKLSRDFILCVGTIEPRKNHLRLVQAYDQVLRADGSAPRLVFVGKPGWGYQGVLDEIKRLERDHDIIQLSDVNGKELAALYASALFVAYPSVYEGFGLPVLEAMACGKPVLTSRNTSMSEVAGGAAFLVDPYSVSSIADGLIRLIHDRRLRTELADRGRARRGAYSWDKTACHILEVLRTL